MIKKLIKDSAAYLPSMIIPAMTGIIAMPIITRLFSPGIYGNYILVITTVSLLSAFTTAWINSSAVRFYSTYETSGELKNFYGTLLKLAILSIGIVSIVFLSVLFLLKDKISSSLFFLMQIGVILFALNSFTGLPSNLLRAKRKVIQYSFFTIWTSVSGMIIGITTALLLHIGVEALILGNIASTLMIMPFLWRTSFGKIFLKYGDICSRMSWEIVKYGIPAIMINVLSWAQSLSDRYVIGLFRGSGEVGIYSPNYTIAESGIFLITSLFLLSSEPIGFDVWEKHGVGESQKFINKVTRYYLIAALPATVGLSLLAQTVTHILVAPQYYAGYVIIPLVAFGAFFVGLAHRFTTTLSYHKRTDLLMFCYLGSIILNVLLNFILIPKYGYVSAAFSTFMSYFFLLLSSIIISRRFLVWKFPFKSLAKCLLSSAIMAAGVYFLTSNLHFNNFINITLEITAGIALYSVSIFLLKEILPEEISATKKFVKEYFSVMGKKLKF